MEKLLVFISSDLVDTKEERDIVAKAIERIPLTETWRFEIATASADTLEYSYLKKVQQCDIFLLILNKTLPDAVQLEYAQARIHNKPRLVFVKNYTDRIQKIDEFVRRSTDIKYRRYDSLSDLEQLSEKAVWTTIIELCRSGTIKPISAEFENAFEEARSNSILQRCFSARFIPMKRFSVKSPIELVKESTQADEILPIMAEMARKDSIIEKIEFAKEQKYAQKYSDSWAEHELEVIGFKLLNDQIADKINLFTDMYDAGCANGGQFNALKALKLLPACHKKISHDFVYSAQDFNSDWKSSFNPKKGDFYDIPLPLIPENAIKYTLLCCTHVMHYFANHPIAIYTSLFSFNKLLKKDGFCYITAPEKESQPGMLDLLERAAIDAGFKIINSGKQRLVQHNDQVTLSITSYLYLVLKKDKEFENSDESKWKQLLGASFFREKHKALSERFAVTREGDIAEDIRVLERDLNVILHENNYYLRTFRYALDIVNNKLKAKNQTMDDCISNIWDSIEKINLLINTNQLNLKELQRECGRYFYYLVEFYIISYNYPNLRQIMYDIYKIAEQVLSSSRDIRVHMDELTDEQVARLLKHLFELCDYENIDLRSGFEHYIKNPTPVT